MKPEANRFRSSAYGAGLTASATLLLTLLVPLDLTAQEPDWESIQMETTRVAEGIYMVVGAGGNIGLSVGDDGAFLVDDQYAPLTEKLRAAIASVGGGDVRFVLNTHWHGDHTGGNENLGDAGTLIVAHENVRRRMNPADFKDLVGRSEQAPDAALPVITFSDAITFHWNGQEIRASHVAHGHTDGDALIYFVGANVVHMGDLFFHEMYPFIDVDSGGSIHGVIEAAERVLALSDSDTKIIPGHGPLANREDLSEYRDMLVTIRDRVQRMINEGMSEDQVVAAAPSREWDDELGGGFIDPERLARLVYRGMVGR